MTVSKTSFFKFTALALITNIMLISLFQTEAYGQETKQIAINQHNLIVLQYHHVSAETPASTSVSPETFAKHMVFLAENYKVMDLADALSKLKNNEPLPNKSVAITFDDGYSNILEHAHPILSKYNFPYTIFINPAIIGDYSSQLSWSEIKEMQPLATFANHTLDHAHLLTKNGDETQKKWLKRVMNDVNQAEEILKENLGYSKKWLAYPFGEFNKALKNELVSQGYIGFGQQSGGISTYSDFGALPRFPAAGVYANLDSLETKMNSFAMPVKSVVPSDNEFEVGDVLDQIIMEIDDSDLRLSSLTCYFKGGTLAIKQNNKKTVIQVDHTMVPGRARINCTAPSNTFRGRFYWYSFPMFTPTLDGLFLD